MFLTSEQRWVRLSLSGQKEWGGFFPDARIPIKCISSQRITFEGFADPESVMAVDWMLLSEDHRGIIIERLLQQGVASLETILDDILKFGLPIRRSQIDCCGIKEWNFLC